MLRITGGTWRGRHLKAPKGDKTRPTSDMVRQAIFNLLGQTMDGGVVVDVCCGSGAMGLEALSRGADHAILVDRARVAVDTARDNALLLAAQDRVTLLCAEASRALASLPPGHAVLALVDPPYALQERHGLLEALVHAVAVDGTVVFETAQEDLLAKLPPGLERVDHRTYGSTGVHILRRVAFTPTPP